MKTLFINACVREDSRTLRLAGRELVHAVGEIEEVRLESEDLRPLRRQSLSERDETIQNKRFDAPAMRLARQLAEADEVVIATPYWDMGFPSLLKLYLEAVTVAGVTFYYEFGVPKTLCRLKKLTYVTTSGGPFSPQFSYDYVRALFEGFFGAKESCCVYCEMLDIDGADVETILQTPKTI